MANIEFAFEQDRCKLTKIKQTATFEYNWIDRLYLTKDVYWVRGSVKSVIHDLRFGILYLLDKHGTITLVNILNHHNCIYDSEKIFINRLLQLRLLTTDESKASDNLLLNQISKPYNITKAYVEITNKCNLKCRHCYNALNDCSTKYISISDFDYTINKLSLAGVKNLCIIGGEPFMCKDEVIRHVISISAKNFEKVTIFSNGTMLTQDIIEFISNFNNVIFSIPYYSDKEIVHDDFTCCKGSHRRLSHNISLLDKFNVSYNLTGIYCKDVCENDEQKSKKVLNYDYVRLSGKGSLSLYSKNLILRRLKTFESLSYEWTKEAISNLYKNRCFARLIYITPDLNVYPCSMERRICHGNIKEIDIAELRHEIVYFSNDNVVECCNCEYRYICSNCPPDTLHGNLNEKPWMCCYCPSKGIWLSREEKLKTLLPHIKYMSK